MVYEGPDLFLQMFDLSWDALTVSMEDAILWRQTAIQKRSDPQGNGVKTDSQSSQLSKNVSKTATSIFKTKFLKAKPWKRNQMPYAETILLIQPDIQSCHRQRHRRDEETFDEVMQRQNRLEVGGPMVGQRKK